jgi:hypothetical protein
MATENQRTSPSSQASIADKRTADTGANESDALGTVWYSISKPRPDRVTVMRSPLDQLTPISQMVVPRDGVAQSSKINGLSAGATLNLPSVFQSFPRANVAPSNGNFGTESTATLAE